MNRIHVLLALVAALGLSACSAPKADLDELSRTVADTLAAQQGTLQKPVVSCTEKLELKENSQTKCELTNPTDNKLYEVTVTYQGENEQENPIYDIKVASSPKQ